MATVGHPRAIRFQWSRAAPGTLQGAPGAPDRSDVPAEVGDWNCGIYTSAFCGELHGPHAKPYSKKLHAEPNAQKRRAWLEGMWMALWPKLDLTIRRLKLGRERKPGGITCA